MNPGTPHAAGEVFLLGVFLIGYFCVLLGYFFNFRPNLACSLVTI